MTDKDVLDKAITGEAVVVRLGDQDYPLTFPVHNVALYSQETAKLNCRRARAAIDSGREKLSPQEIRKLRTTFLRLADERYLKQHEYKLTDDNSEKVTIVVELTAIAEEMIAVDTRLAEESGSGDSLFKIINWWKIRDDDPERAHLALWCGLHAEVSAGKWESPFTLAQLDKLVDASNIIEVLTKITLALGKYLPKVEESPKGDRPQSEAPAADEAVTTS